VAGAAEHFEVVLVVVAAPCAVLPFAGYFVIDFGFLGEDEA
jgi:hypothetical protein